jgi:hypothetical protein
MVAHGGTSVAGSFIQTLTMVDVATGWTECLPLVTRDGSLVVEALKRAQSLFPWLLRGVDFDNDSAFMNDVVVPWCREQKLEVTRSRAYKKNDQAFVEQKNGAVVRRLLGYGRFDGVETARMMTRLYAAARLYVNFFQPSFKLKEKRREGAKVIKHYHPPSTPCARALAHPKLRAAVKERLRGSIARSIRSHCWQRSAPSRRNSAIASIVVPEIRAVSNVPARAPRRSRCNCQRRTQWLLQRRSARRSRPASRVPHTGEPSGLIRRGFGCRPSWTRTWH